jgi:CHAT domain-containing protein
LGGAVGLQHRSWRQARRGSAVGPRARLYAGARALLLSHWSVDSEAATRLTTSTFTVMKSDPKLGRAAALRNAMLACMNDKSSR